MNWDSIDEAMKRRRERHGKAWDKYFGFYSSWLDGYFREPWAMTLPIDDHGFHRGDGVFEAVRLQAGAYFVLPMHLERLQESASAIGMKLPKTLPEIQEICLNLARLAGQENGLLRLFVTRGPGSFTPNPYDSEGAQFYAVLTSLRLLPEERYVNGCRAMISSVLAKEAPWSRIKSCNYLQNVLMKKECVEKGFDLAIGIDVHGRVCEGATENMMILNTAGELIVPSFDYTLKGTTMRVVMELAKKHLGRGIKSVRLDHVLPEELYDAREAAFVGTTLGVLPIASIDDRPIGAGRAGDVMQMLNRDLNQAIESDRSVRTPL